MISYLKITENLKTAGQSIIKGEVENLKFIHKILTISRKKRRYLRYCPEGSRYKNMAKIRKREISISTTAMAEPMGKSRRSSKKYSIFWKCVLCVVRKLRVSKKNNEHYIDRNTPGKNKNPRSIFTCFYLKAPSKIISANLTFRSLTAPDNSNIPLVLSVTIKVKVFS